MIDFFYLFSRMVVTELAYVCVMRGRETLSLRTSGDSYQVNSACYLVAEAIGMRCIRIESRCKTYIQYFLKGLV